MDVVHVTSEIAPYSKTGGLADVCAALAQTQASLGRRVLTVSPLYPGIEPVALGATPLGEVDIVLARYRQVAKLWQTPSRPGQPVHVFVQHVVYDRAGVYGDQHGGFRDNHLRFALLCRCALEAARRVRFSSTAAALADTPLADDTVFHVHDWPSAMLPAYLDTYYRPLGHFRRSPVVLTVHNPAHQGRLPAALFDDLDLPGRWFGPSGFEWFGDLGLLKCGLVLADQITTVSPTFAWEITTPEGGFGLDAILRGRFADLTGILNGIDSAVWDPATDPHLAEPFTADDLSGKAVCKAALQAEFGLPMLAAAPLIGNIGRLDPQKGVDQLFDSIPWIVDQGCQVVILGSAAGPYQHFEAQLRELEWRFPDNVRAYIGYDEPLAHRIEAAADLFLMPSLFEPCGLNQLYSMRYGTVPVVRRTGGLADSVTPHDQPGGTGFLYTQSTGFALRTTLHQALSLYHDDRPSFTALQRNGMRRDSSWDAVLPKYDVVYRRALARRAER